MHYQSKAFRAAQWAYDNMSPPEDDSSETECEECETYFDFDPAEYMDCDGESVYCTPPTTCPECACGLTPYIGITVYVYDAEETHSILGPCTVLAAEDGGALLTVEVINGPDTGLEFEVFDTDLVHGPQQLPSNL